MSAAVVAMAARVAGEAWPEAGGAVAQAEAIRQRVAPLAGEDARVYAAALEAMRSPVGDTPEDRDAAISNALVAAAAVPLEIAESAADVAALAGTVAERGSDATRGDAAAAALLSAAAAHASANLVAVNLVASAHEGRVAQARRAAAQASDAARWALDLE
jgi:formiminotetrahydrofolate cyclodeaminase